MTNYREVAMSFAAIENPRTGEYGVRGSSSRWIPARGSRR